jgi:hypothetical protein
MRVYIYIYIYIYINHLQLIMKFQYVNEKRIITSVGLYFKGSVCIFGYL